MVDTTGISSKVLVKGRKHILNSKFLRATFDQNLKPHVFIESLRPGRPTAKRLYVDLVDSGFEDNWVKPKTGEIIPLDLLLFYLMGAEVLTEYIDFERICGTKPVYKERPFPKDASRSTGRIYGQCKRGRRDGCVFVTHLEIHELARIQGVMREITNNHISRTVTYLFGAMRIVQDAEGKPQLLAWLENINKPGKQQLLNPASSYRHD